MLFDGLLIEHQCRPRAVAAADASPSIIYRSPFLTSLLGSSHPMLAGTNTFNLEADRIWGKVLRAFSENPLGQSHHSRLYVKVKVAVVLYRKR
jgi:hypothetical protein